MKQQIRLICLSLLSLLFLLMININILANEDTTIIDVSNMSIGENVIHNHIYKSQYDDTNHWTECLVCHNKQNITKHTISTTWQFGYESCEPHNYATKTCKCGYNIIFYKPCVWKGEYVIIQNYFFHRKKCAVCNKAIEKRYYLNSYGNGVIYEGDTRENCKNSNGKEITCANGGTCTICKGTHTKGAHLFSVQSTTEENLISCLYCNLNYGYHDPVDISYSTTTPTQITCRVNIHLKNGATFYQSTSTNYLVNTDNGYSSQSNTYTIDSSKTNATIVYKAQLNNVHNSQYTTRAVFSIVVNGKTYNIQGRWFPISTEIIKPTITNIETNDVSITNNDWITSKKIKISGIENYTNTVSIEVVDENNEVAYSGTTSVSNKNYSFEFIPKIEANEKEKTYTISVTDANNNTTTNELVVKKVDAKEPTFVIIDKENMSQDANDNSIINEKGGWAKSKTYDLFFKDEGIGNVSIGVNNYDDIILATYDESIGAYKRNYTFVGDAYAPVNCVVYAKDSLGNLSTTTLVLDKIDNTSPTIEKVDKEINIVEVLSATSDELTPNNEVNQTTYANIIITANDINEKLGLEGSGVVSYGVQSSNNNENNEIVWYDTNEIEITQNGTYYIYAMDYVGNISQPMLLVVDELTSSEDNNGNKVNVYVTQASTFSVVIPKTIILSGETKNGTYQILVKGDIGGLDSISITPDNLLAMKQYGKDDILANVTQDKTTFNLNDGMTSETPTTTNGTIVAPNMTAGSWSGSFNFNIKFNVIGNTNSIGSIKEDATSENIVGQDQVQDKYTTYTYGLENKDIDENVEND